MAHKRHLSVLAVVPGVAHDSTVVERELFASFKALDPGVDIEVLTGEDTATFNIRQMGLHARYHRRELVVLVHGAISVTGVHQLHVHPCDPGGSTILRRTDGICLSSIAQIVGSFAAARRLLVISPGPSVIVRNGTQVMMPVDLEFRLALKAVARQLGQNSQTLLATSVPDLCDASLCEPNCTGDAVMALINLGESGPVHADEGPPSLRRRPKSRGPLVETSRIGGYPLGRLIAEAPAAVRDLLIKA